MRTPSMTKMTSEPNLLANRSGGSGSSGKSRGNKPFAPIKRSSITGPSASSFKLSPNIRNILSQDLKSNSSHSKSSNSHNNTPASYGYGVYGDDTNIQSMSSSRRRFQRRGSKSASMFKAFSTNNLMLPRSFFEGVIDMEKEGLATNNNAHARNANRNSSLNHTIHTTTPTTTPRNNNTFHDIDVDTINTRTANLLLRSSEEGGVSKVSVSQRSCVSGLEDDSASTLMGDSMSEEFGCSMSEEFGCPMVSEEFGCE